MSAVPEKLAGRKPTADERKALMQAQATSADWGKQLGRSALVRGELLFGAVEGRPAPLGVLLDRPGKHYADFKLELLALWLAGSDRPRGGGPPYEARVSLLHLVDMLGLRHLRRDDDAQSRVRHGLKRLTKLRLIELPSTRGASWTIRLLRDDASGRPYTKPRGTDDPYQKLPKEFFTSGWLAQLPGNAIAAYLCIARLQEQGRGAPAWLNDTLAARQIGGLRRATRDPALRLCCDLGLLEMDRNVKHRSGRHNEYSVVPDAFRQAAPDVRPRPR